MPKTITKAKKKRSAFQRFALASMIPLSCLGALHFFKVALAATSTLPIKARLIRAIEVTVSTSLNFGTLAMTQDRGGQARMDPGANRLVVDNNSSLSLAGGVPQAGRLIIKGAAHPISISIEDSVVNLTNGVTSVSVNDFNFIREGAGNKVTVTPSADDQVFTVAVGATLVTKPKQASGSYVGTTRIFANFQ